MRPSHARSHSPRGADSSKAIAETGPFVIVVEDIHWADESLLAFLEHLADWAQGVPLLIVCTARPELYEQHPAWAVGLANATPIRLSPLSNDETARADHGAARQGRTSSRDAAVDPRPCRRQPAVCGGVRAHAARPRAARHPQHAPHRGRDTLPRFDPRANRGSSRHARYRSQELAPGRRRDRQGVLGRRARRHG